MMPLAGVNSNRRKVMANRYDEVGREGSRNYARMYTDGVTAGLQTGSGLEGKSHGLGSSSV